MNIKKKNLVLIALSMFIFGALLSCGIFAVVTKSVSFNLALKLDPQIFFSLSMKIDYNGDGDYTDAQNNINESSSYKIFDNKTGESVVTWATVNQNCIVLNQVLAGDILSNLTINSRFEITVTNLTAKSNAVEYLNLTLNYNGAEEVFKIDNGYGAVNMEYGVASGDTSATKTFTLIPQTTLLDGYIQIPFKAEIDTEKRYTATITTTNCEVVSAPVMVGSNKAYTAEFRAIHIYDPVFSYVVTIKGNSYATSENTNLLTIPANAVIGDITITVTATRSQYWSGTAAAAFSGGDGTEANPFQIAHADELGLMSWLVNNKNTATTYSGSATLNNKTVTVSATCRTDITFGTAYYVLTNHIYLNKGYENFHNWTECAPNLMGWIPISNFLGRFNGDSYKIHGLFINNPTRRDQGLFSGIGGTTEIIDLIIGSGLIIGKHNVGAIAGMVGGSGSIYNCINYATVLSVGVNTSGHAHTGGICGQQTSIVNINFCSNYGKVCAKSMGVGGIVGITTNAGCTNCFNNGIIEGYEVGGIVGAIRSNDTPSIINCYNTGTIKSTLPYSAGGIVGSVSTKSNIYNCYNIGNVISEFNGNGGIYGRLNTTITFSSNYNYSSIQSILGTGSNGNATIDASTKLLSSEMTVGSYTGNNLLDALNAYVTANPGNGYLNWVEGPDGWPVFGTIKN